MICRKCGQPLTRKTVYLCSKCQTAYDAPAKFCKKCRGQSFDPIEAWGCANAACAGANATSERSYVDNLDFMKKLHALGWISTPAKSPLPPSRPRQQKSSQTNRGLDDNTRIYIDDLKRDNEELKERASALNDRLKSAEQEKDNLNRRSRLAFMIGIPVICVLALALILSLTMLHRAKSKPVEIDEGTAQTSVTTDQTTATGTDEASVTTETTAALTEAAAKKTTTVQTTVLTTQMTSSEAPVQTTAAQSTAPVSEQDRVKELIRRIDSGQITERAVPGAVQFRSLVVYGNLTDSDKGGEILLTAQNTEKRSDLIYYYDEYTQGQLFKVGVTADNNSIEGSPYYIYVVGRAAGEPVWAIFRDSGTGELGAARMPIRRIAEDGSLILIEEEQPVVTEPPQIVEEQPAEQPVQPAQEETITRWDTITEVEVVDQNAETTTPPPTEPPETSAGG